MLYLMKINNQRTVYTKFHPRKLINPQTSLYRPWGGGGHERRI